MAGSGWRQTMPGHRREEYGHGFHLNAESVTVLIVDADRSTTAWVGTRSIATYLAPQHGRRVRSSEG
jgi:hypothetical protein